MKRFQPLLTFCFALASFSTLLSAELTINGIVVDEFDPNRNEYKHYLPFDHHGMLTVKLGNQRYSVDIFPTAASFDFTIGEERKKYTIAVERLPKLDLFLCIGQSNMAGRGQMEEAQGDLEAIPNVYLFTPSGNWVPASNPLNRYSTVRKEIEMQQISPAYSFARKIAAQTNRPIGLVVNARGGTSIESWTKGHRDGLYEAALERALDAKKWGEYKAILWHQGESNLGRFAAYPEQLRRMVSDFRNDLGGNNLFFVAGELPCVLLSLTRCIKFATLPFVR